MDKVVEEYVQDVLNVLKAELRSDLAAVWLAGSLASRDFFLELSDVDIIAVTHGSPSLESKKRIAEKLRYSRLFCPAHGLDFIVYNEAELRIIGQSLQYEFSIETGCDWVDEISFGGPYPGGVVDLVLLRQRGISLFGPPPQALVGSNHVAAGLRRGLPARRHVY